MTDRSRQPELDELERSLADLGSHLAYPPTPDLASTVRARLASEAQRPRLWRRAFWTRPAVALAAAMLAVLLVAGLVLAASPEARTAIAERLGVPGVTIWYVPIVPERTPPVATPFDVSRTTPLPANVRQTFGERLGSLAEARGRVPFTVLAPTHPDLGPPDEVYLGARPVGGQLALVYLPGAGLPETPETGVGLLVTQFQGRLEPGLFGKGLPQGSRVEQVTVNGRPAYWISGRPHFFIYRDRSDAIADERIRLAGNVLLWEQGGLTLRIEGAIAREQAIQIAESVR